MLGFSADEEAAVIFPNPRAAIWRFGSNRRYISNTKPQRQAIIRRLHQHKGGHYLTAKWPVPRATTGRAFVEVCEGVGEEV